MTVRTWVGRFCVAGGRVEEQGPWLGSLVRQRPDDEEDELHVLVEPALAGSDEYVKQLVDVIAGLYGKDPLSLTGALMRSLRAAHDHLREWNRKSLREHRVGAGATVLALRGREAYLAQVGPSLAYVRTSNGELRRLESHDASFDGSLGIAQDFQPRLTRIELQPDDLVLLASSRLEAIAPQEHVQRVLDRGADDALPELYMLCRDEPDFALVLLSCFEEETEMPPQFLRRDGDDESEAAAVGEPAIDDAASAALAGQPVVAASAAAAASAGRPPLASATMAAGVPFELPQRPAKEQVKEIHASTAPRKATGVRVRGDIAPPRFKKTTGAAPLPTVRVPRLALLAVIAVAAVIGLLWWQLPGSVRADREEEFVALVAEARESHARAQATTDPALKRELLTTARSSLVDAEKIHDDNPELLALQSDVSAAIGVLDAVVEVRGFTQVADIAQLTTRSLAVTQTVIGGGYAFLIDERDGRVLRVPLGGRPAVDTVAEAGQGDAQSIGRPVSVAWSETLQALLILDDARHLFAYYPSQGNSLPLTLRGAEDLASADAIAVSGANLYILDRASGQVWRYLPGQNGFDSERTALLDGASLEDATELAVAHDVFVLDREQGIRRFSDRTEGSFPLAGIDRPLMEPAALSVLPGSNRLVVADRSNKRIVVASPEGEFQKQIVSPSFTDLRAVAVDEGARVMYVLNGNELITAPFPP